MPLRVVRLGSPRHPDEGLRLGTVRRVPRGVKKQDYARLDYFDLWLPDLAPTSELVSWALSKPFTPRRWATYSRRYRSQMRSPEAGTVTRVTLVRLPSVTHAFDQNQRFVPAVFARSVLNPVTDKKVRPKTAIKGKRYRCAKCRKRSSKPVKTPAPWYCPGCAKDKEAQQ
jgi:uncharacterized protein YeaO (DUF488 family)